MQYKKYKIKGIDQEIYFKEVNALDGLNISTYASFLEKDDPVTVAKAMGLLSDIILKYAYVGDECIKDVAGLELVKTTNNPLILSEIIESFMKSYTEENL